jgi:hypothetical protein
MLKNTYKIYISITARALLSLLAMRNLALRTDPF